MSRLYRVVTFDCLQVCKTEDRQSLLIALSLIDHPVDPLCQDFPRLLHYRLITVLKLSVNGESALDGRGGYNLFNRIGDGLNLLLGGTLFHISGSVF